MNNLDSWGWVAFVMLGLAWIGEAIHRARSGSSMGTTPKYDAQPPTPNPDEPWLPDCYVTRRYGPQDFDTDGADWVGK